MIFVGYLEDCYHLLEIYKKDSNVHIKYNVKRREFGSRNPEIIVEEEYTLL